jgi:hypothetical protein
LDDRVSVAIQPQPPCFRGDAGERQISRQDNDRFAWSRGAKRMAGKRFGGVVFQKSLLTGRA